MIFIIFFFFYLRILKNMLYPINTSRSVFRNRKTNTELREKKFVGTLLLLLLMLCKRDGQVNTVYFEKIKAFSKSCPAPRKYDEKKQKIIEDNYNVNNNTVR